jgi:hypothetical protein
LSLVYSTAQTSKSSQALILYLSIVSRAQHFYPF